MVEGTIAKNVIAIKVGTMQYIYETYNNFIIIYKEYAEQYK